MQENQEVVLLQDIWLYISQFLTAKDLLFLRLTCKEFNQLFELDFARRWMRNFFIKQVEIDAVAGPENIFFLDNQGKVWRCTHRRFSEMIPSFPKIMLNLPPIKEIVTNDKASFFLTTKGDVFALGMNNHGQLGLRSRFKKTKIITIPKIIENLKSIKQIAASPGNTLFLDKRGIVFGCGINSYGELGLGHKKKQFIAQRIDKLPPIIQIAASEGISFFLDHENAVWVAGTDNLGYLTRGRSGFMANFWAEAVRPIKLTNLPKIKKIVSTRERTFFLTLTGKVYACGLNNYGSIGCKTTEQIVYFAQIIPDLIEIEEVFPFDNLTIFLDKNKKGWICGSTEFGIPNLKETGHPAPIGNLKNIEKVFKKRFGQEERLVFIDSHTNAWTWVKSQGEEKVALVKIEELSQANYLLPDCLCTLIIDHFGNLKIEGLSALSQWISKIVPIVATPFNFMTDHQLNVLKSCHFSLDKLLELACSNSDNNEIFYHALINILGTKERGIRLHYLIQLQDSKWKNLHEFSSLLLSINDRFIPATKDKNEQCALVNAFVNFYNNLIAEYKNSKNDEQLEKSINWFLDLLHSDNLHSFLTENCKLKKSFTLFSPPLSTRQKSCKTLLNLLNSQDDLARLKQMVALFLEAIKNSTEISGLVAVLKEQITNQEKLSLEI